VALLILAGPNDRHRPDAARHRGNGVGHFKRLGKIDITDDAGFAA